MLYRPVYSPCSVRKTASAYPAEVSECGDPFILVLEFQNRCILGLSPSSPEREQANSGPGPKSLGSGNLLTECLTSMKLRGGRPGLSQIPQPNFKNFRTARQGSKLQ